MNTIDRKRLQAFLNESGDALRRLSGYLANAGRPGTVAGTTKLADEADALLELVETGADIDGDL